MLKVGGEEGMLNSHLAFILSGDPGKITAPQLPANSASPSPRAYQGTH